MYSLRRTASRRRRALLMGVTLLTVLLVQSHSAHAYWDVDDVVRGQSYCTWQAQLDASVHRNYYGYWEDGRTVLTIEVDDNLSQFGSTGGPVRFVCRHADGGTLERTYDLELQVDLLTAPYTEGWPTWEPPNPNRDPVYQLCTSPGPLMIASTQPGPDWGGIPTTNVSSGGQIQASFQFGTPGLHQEHHNYSHGYGGPEGMNAIGEAGHVWVREGSELGAFIGSGKREAHHTRWIIKPDANGDCNDVFVEGVFEGAGHPL